MCTLREDEASRLYCYRDPFREGCVGPSSDRETFAIRRAPDLGALLTLGVGNYAPSLVTFSLLGIDPRAAFPIMMGTGAFVATIAGVRLITSGRFHGRAALGLTVGGIAGVIIAAWLVQSLPLEALRWLVLVVVSYAAITLLRAGWRRPPSAQVDAERPKPVYIPLR